MSSDWIRAGSTIAYTIGTFLLWWVTSRSLTATREALWLSLLVEYYRTQEPAPNVGHPWETREVPQRIEEVRKRQAEVMRLAFPEVRKF